MLVGGVVQAKRLVRRECSAFSQGGTTPRSGFQSPAMSRIRGDDMGYAKDVGRKASVHALHFQTEGRQLKAYPFLRLSNLVVLVYPPTCRPILRAPVCIFIIITSFLLLP